MYTVAISAFAFFIFSASTIFMISKSMLKGTVSQNFLQLLFWPFHMTFQYYSQGCDDISTKSSTLYLNFAPTQYTAFSLL